jgi:hypothetical protein
MSHWRVAVCLVIVAIGVIACGLFRDEPDPVVDGWPIGARTVAMSLMPR